MIPHKRIVQWMNLIRIEQGDIQYRLLENFWESQLNSKSWLVESVLRYCIIPENSTIYIFGGWYGILAQLLVDVFPTCTIISIDIDENCDYYGNLLKLPNDNIHFRTLDMRLWDRYEPNASLVINTSTEHITQDIFDEWIHHVPENVNIVLQGNNFFSCSEHIRCVSSLSEFKKINKMNKIKFAGELDCVQFTRYMTIGTNNANY